MQPAVTYSKRGTADLTKALEHISTYARDAKEFTNQVSRILAELNYLASTPMLGNPVPDTKDGERYWLILDKRYRVYYKRIDESHIIIGMFRSTKAKPVTIAEIKRSFGKQ